MLPTLNEEKVDCTSPPLPGLTKYPVGSLKELWTLAFPLMLCALSGTLMLFIDRVVLSHYSTAAMNAASAAATVFAIFQFGALSIASISEVFVGQYNGAQLKHMVGRPVWQMVWFSLFTIIPFAFLSFFCSRFLPVELSVEGEPFLKWLLLFGPLAPLNAALSSFFVGQGKVRIVTLSIAIAGLVNLLLCVLLVFGIAGFPGQGAKGAAIATGIAQLFTSVLLFTLFLNRHNRREHSTHNWHFDSKLFYQCLKIGVPNALGHMVALVAWSLVSLLLAQISFVHITVFAIAQSIWILLTFVTDGSQKAVTAVCSNLIGAGHRQAISNVFQGGIKLQLCIALLLAVPLLVFPDLLVQCFLPSELEGVDPYLIQLASTSCKWIWLALILDGMTWIIAGILTSAGDTRFIMLLNAFHSWVFGIVPYYVLMVYFNAPPIVAIYLMAAYSFINLFCFYQRFRTARWYMLKAVAF